MIGLRKGGHGQGGSDQITEVSLEWQAGESALYSGGKGEPAKILEKMTHLTKPGL